jgi:hypothetical protein
VIEPERAKVSPTPDQCLRELFLCLTGNSAHRLIICMQDMALDEDEDEEDDQEEDLVSESEDEDPFDADGAADEDGHLDDEENVDGEVDDAYLKRLERESRRLKVCNLPLIHLFARLHALLLCRRCQAMLL